MGSRNFSHLYYNDLYHWSTSSLHSTIQVIYFMNSKLLVCILFFFFSLDATCQVSKESMIDKIMESYNHTDQPGASILVMSDGKVVFKKGYGISNIVTKEKIHPQTNFRLASVTKQFTAMCILLLEERGMLSLEDKLSKFFPDFPSYGKDIRIVDLLTHSSGLIDYEDLMPADQSVQLHDIDCLKLMYTSDSLYFSAGTDYRYSNTGYALLALIVEKVSKQSFASFLNENIFIPLKMSSTLAHEEGKSIVQ